MQKNNNNKPPKKEQNSFNFKKINYHKHGTQVTSYELEFQVFQNLLKCSQLQGGIYI